MPIGDVVSDIQTITTGAFLSIQPGAGIEIILHNIGHQAGVELYFYDGTNSILIDADTAAGSWMSIFLHCTNTKYYRVKNTDAASKLISYDGCQTK